MLNFAIASGQQGFRTTRRVENGYEILESETGAVTRQVIDNNITYSMPEFVRYAFYDNPELIHDMIEPEIRKRAPALLEKGRYFPNGDHGIQPLATFPSLCMFMTILHEVCNNPDGEFPRA